MNKNFSKAFENAGMKIIGNRAYGFVKGYEVNATLDFYSAMPVKLYFTCRADAEKLSELQQAAFIADKVRTAVEIKRFGVEVCVGGNNRIKDTLKGVEALLEYFPAALKKAGANGEGFCPVCGEKLTAGGAHLHTLNGITVTMDDDCAEKTNDIIKEENERFKYAPGNYGKGFLGALIGTLAGAAIAVALFFAGFIAALSSFVAAVLGFYLYGKFGGKRDKNMIIIVALTVVVGMELAVFGIYLVDIAVAGAQNGVSFLEAYRILMAAAEYRNGMILNLVLTFVFSAAGMIEEVIRAARSVKRDGEIK